MTKVFQGLKIINHKKYSHHSNNCREYQIKKAVEEVFGVKVAAVNTMRVNGKEKRMGRYVGKTAAWKKAIVTLTADSKTIEFFDGMM